MRELVSSEDLLSVTSLNKFRSQIIGKSLLRITGIKEVNDLYSQLEGNKGVEFIDAFFKQLNIKLEFDQKDLRKIPAKGSFITVSNHPFGAIDGLILLKLIAQKRPDFKVLANFLLQNVSEISDHFIPVNPFEGIKKEGNLKGVKLTLEHLSSGGGIGIFPAGEVSSYQTNTRKVTDKQWSPSTIKLIKHAEVPVVPIYFSGGNSLFFHLLGIINPKLRTAQLPKEMLKKRDAVLQVRIGSPVTVEQQKQFRSTQKLGRFLRAKTYSLGSALEVRKFYVKKLQLLNKKQEVVPPVETHLLEKDIAGLDKSQLLLTQQSYRLYLAYSDEIPNILTEIGRLREETFRGVGEGTQKTIDIDEYDLYYHHLFLWDDITKMVVGAYRIGKGDDILAKYGVNGFYTNSLFKMKKKLHPVLQETLELGRSFVRPEYQLKRLPLFMLWRGIIKFTEQNEQYRYLLGPVSISNNYARFSQKLIVQFIKKYYWNQQFAQHVKPRKKFKDTIKELDVSQLAQFDSDDLQTVDQLIRDIEPLHFSAPVLLKKYIHQNAKIIGFNVDPKFSKALDGLMILDVNTLPEDSFLKE